MNREIVTQQKIDELSTRAKFIRSKIDATNSFDTSLLNKDLAAIDLPLLKPIRNRGIKNNLSQEGIYQARISDDILDGDLSPQEIDKVKQLRIEKLKEIEESANTGTKKADDYIDKLVKYIPTEVIAFYLTLTGILASETTENKLIYAYSLFVVGMAITVLYLKSVWKVRSNVQVALSCFAFLIWAISLDDYLDIPNTVKALLLPIVTFALPLIDPPILKEDKR